MCNSNNCYLKTRNNQPLYASRNDLGAIQTSSSTKVSQQKTKRKSKFIQSCIHCKNMVKIKKSVPSTSVDEHIVKKYGDKVVQFFFEQRNHQVLENFCFIVPTPFLLGGFYAKNRFAYFA